MLSRSRDKFCLKKHSLSIRLEQCGTDEEFLFDLDDNDQELRYSSTVNSGKKKLMVGIDETRIYSQLFLYKEGGFNPTLSFWQSNYGPFPPDCSNSEQEFRISTSHLGDTWCALPKALVDRSFVVMRPCTSFDVDEIDVQLWKRTEDGQIRLSRSGDKYCLKKQRFDLTLEQCSSDKEFKFDLDNGGHIMWSIFENGYFFMVGFDEKEIVPQLRLYKMVSTISSSSSPSWVKFIGFPEKALLP